MREGAAISAVPCLQVADLQAFTANQDHPVHGPRIHGPVYMVPYTLFVTTSNVGRLNMSGDKQTPYIEGYRCGAKVLTDYIIEKHRDPPLPQLPQRSERLTRPPRPPAPGRSVCTNRTQTTHPRRQSPNSRTGRKTSHANRTQTHPRRSPPPGRKAKIRRLMEVNLGLRPVTPEDLLP